MRRTALLMHIPEQEAPETRSEKVVAVSQIASYNGQQYLNIDLFYKGELKGRYFADRLTHACYVDGSWRTCKINNVARICMGKPSLKGAESYYCGDDWMWNSSDDRNTVHEYLGKRLEWYEDDINHSKYMDALKKKEKRVEELMSLVPYLPDGLEPWLKTKIFPLNYLFIKRTKTRTDYSCTACGSSGWKKIGWKHNEKTICPKCGQPVTAYLRKQEIQKKEPVVVLQIMGEYDWIERQLRAICTWTPGKKEIEILEDIRVIIPRDKTWGKVWYGTYSERSEKGQDFWDKNQANKRFYESYLYPDNLKEVLPYGGTIQYSGLAVIAEMQRKINVNSFITTFTRRRWMEYWIKAGLIKLAAEVTKEYGMWGNPSYIRESREKLTENLKINGNRLYRLKILDGGINALKWLQYEEEMEHQGKQMKISQESLSFLSKNNSTPDDCQEILKALGSINRMVNYIKKQNVSSNKLVSNWNDYLRMAEAEGMDVTDDIVRFPKDLKIRHDELVERINARRDAEKLKKQAKMYKGLNKGIIQHLPEAKRYFWEDKDYMIIPAGKCEELVEEGRTLHHCVGASTTYMEKMAAGKSWILFLRKKKELEKPYYTIEISMENDGILQWYSEYDRKPDEGKIQKVLNAFKNSIKRQTERIQIAG